MVPYNNSNSYNAYSGRVWNVLGYVRAASVKQKLKSGAEFDWVGSWRKFYCYLSRSGVGKSIKRGMNKRIRKEGKNEVRDRE